MVSPQHLRVPSIGAKYVSSARPAIRAGDKSPMGLSYGQDMPAHDTPMIHVELEQIDEVSEQKTARQKYIDKLNLFAFGGNMRNTLPSNTKKKEKKGIYREMD